MKIYTLAVSLFLCISCSPADDGVAADGTVSALAIGDSVLAWNARSKRSVGAALGRELGIGVKNNSRVSAMVTRRRGIPSQYQTGDWDFVLVNGGANDFIFRCGCSIRCAPVLDRLVGPEGTGGALPQLLTQIRDDGHDVIYAGYHRPRQIRTPMKICGPYLDALERRMAKFAAQTDGVTYANIQNVFPAGDASYYYWDRIHPSPKGSRVIAQAIAPLVQ